MTIDLKLHCDFKKGERGRERWAIGLSFKLGHISGLVFLKKNVKAWQNMSPQNMPF